MMFWTPSKDKEVVLIPVGTPFAVGQKVGPGCPRPWWQSLHLQGAGLWSDPVRCKLVPCGRWQALSFLLFVRDLIALSSWCISGVGHCFHLHPEDSCPQGWRAPPTADEL